MKIVEITCPTCGAKLNLQESASRLITCEYCGNQVLLDDERNQTNGNQTAYPGYGRPPVTVYRDPASKGRMSQGMAVAISIIVAGMVMLLAYFFLGVLNAFENGYDSYADEYEFTLPDYDGTGTYETSAEWFPESELYVAMTEEMFGKDTGVTERELARVKYLKVVDSWETSQVWYSFDDPYGEAPDIREASFSGMEWDDRDIGNFTGLVRLDISYGASDNLDLSGLTQLKGLVTDGVELTWIAETVTDPAQITELRLKRITSMDGISSFVNLERLSIRNMPDKNLKQLVALKNLKELCLEDTIRSDSISVHEDELRVTDYSAVSAMTGLESLSIRSDIIRDVGFLKNLPNLTSLSLEDSTVISVEPLTEMTGLRSLCLLTNNEVKDYEMIGRMTWLTELTIDKLTSQSDPDLSGMSGLEKLDISGFMSVASLKGLSSIRDLSIHGCNVDGADALSTLTGVERLTFYSVWKTSGHYIQSLRFVDGMTNLKYADFNGNLDGSGWEGYNYGVEVFGDISSVFNHAGIEELYLDSALFEVDFDRVAENPSLRVLSMRDVELHNHFVVEDYGGILSAWYDDVFLKDHLEFFTKFPNLEELYLDSNELTDLAFTRELKKLSRLSVKDNYITDLSPLAQAEHLTYLNIADNPVGKWDDADEDVEVIQE